MNIIELHYSNTNTYLIQGSKGYLLFDTGWAGSFPAFCKSLGEAGVKLSDISMILISHYHPDHMGIAGEITDKGPVLLVCDVQRDFLHSSDHIFEKENRKDYVPIDESKARVISIGDSRKVLGEIGIDGEIIATPGHSDDSISLLLDSGELFVGDLNPLYELELHVGTEIGRSWEKILAKKPKRVYYGHAKTAVLVETEGVGENSPAEACSVERADGRRENGGNPLAETCSVKKPEGQRERGTAASGQDDLFRLVSRIMKLIDKKMPLSKIAVKTGADEAFVTDVARMYLTHQNVGVQGILDRIEIKNR